MTMISTDMKDLLPHMDIRNSDASLFDYGKLYQSTGRYGVTYPESTDQLIDIVDACRQHDVSIRVRASGHTFSGATLPNENELLVRTDKLDHYRFDKEGTITVGAGALVWDIRDLARDYGFDLPVWNGGWAGPTIGGYINAGGFGKSGRSEIHGGLWENVESITYVDGLGQIRTIGRSESVFPWLFGSYGQLGLLVEARMNLISFEEDDTPQYPTGVSGRIPKRQEDDPKDNEKPPPRDGEQRLFWFSLLISPEQQPRAWVDLYKWVRDHKDIIVPEGGWAGLPWRGAPMGYHYTIRYKNFNPPLVYNIDETFLVIGVMCRFKSGFPDVNEKIVEVETEFIDLAVNGDYKLYLQAENIGRTVDFMSYYGDEVYHTFKDYKSQFDPDGIINPGVFFPKL